MGNNKSISKLKELFEELQSYPQYRIRLPHEIRHDIFDIVSQSHDPQITRFLIEELQHSTYPKRTTAAEALGRTRDLTAVEVLLNILKNDDEDEEIRSEAAEALGRIGAISAVPTLIEMMRNKRNGRIVMWHCADALGYFRGKAVVDALIDALIEDYSEIKDSSDIRDAAGDALAAIGDDYAVAQLLALLERESLSPKDYMDITLRGEIIWALGKTKNPRCIDPLLTILNDPQIDDALHASATLGLSNFSDPRVISALRVALTHPNEMVRIQAKIALEKLGHKGDE